MHALRIILLSVACAVVYGVIHDQVTARVCVEYFTIAHPPIFHTDSPTLLGLGWGVVATWWMGLILGIPLALSARAGPPPYLSSKDLLRPLGILLLCMAVLALGAGMVGYRAARSGWVALPPIAWDRIPAHKHAAFFADVYAHLASYALGFFGGLGLCAWAAIRRRRLSLSRKQTVQEPSNISGSNPPT
jgi:hypothetical protein